MEDNKKIFKDVNAGDNVWFVTGAKSGDPSFRTGRVTSVRPDANNALVLFDTDVQNVAVPLASLFKGRIEFGAGDGLTAVHTCLDAAETEYREGLARLEATAPKEPADGDGEYTVADLINDVANAFADALHGVLSEAESGGDGDESGDGEEPIDLGIETEIPAAESPAAPDSHTRLTENAARRETSASVYPSVPAVLMITVTPSGCEKLDRDYYSDPALHAPNPLYLDHGVHYLHDVLIPDFRRPAALYDPDDGRFFGDDIEADAAACMIEDWIDDNYPELARLDYGQDNDWYYEVLPGSAISVGDGQVELNPFKGE